MYFQENTDLDYVPIFGVNFKPRKNNKNQNGQTHGFTFFDPFIYKKLKLTKRCFNCTNYK